MKIRSAWGVWVRLGGGVKFDTKILGGGGRSVWGTTKRNWGEAYLGPTPEKGRDNGTAGTSEGELSWVLQLNQMQRHHQKKNGPFPSSDGGETLKGGFRDQATVVTG